MGESIGGDKASAELGLAELRRRRKQAADDALEEMRLMGLVGDEEGLPDWAERGRRKMEEGGGE